MLKIQFKGTLKKISSAVNKAEYLFQIGTI